VSAILTLSRGVIAQPSQQSLPILCESAVDVEDFAVKNKLNAQWIGLIESNKLAFVLYRKKNEDWLIIATNGKVSCFLGIGKINELRSKDQE
jgi:hypothetical protein